MAEHRVPKGNIIYIIPTDELFIKYKNNEAFIDEYGRLMNRKPHRVLKELKHYVADSEMQESYASSIKDLVRDKMVEYSKYAIDRVGDVFFYEVIPNVWHKHIVPLWNGAKDVLFSKELKIDQIKCETEYKVVENQSIFSETMTKEEVDAEKRKLLYHWIGLLSSLTKLRNAGELFFMFSGEKVLVDLRCDNSLMKTMVDRFGEDVTTLAYDMTSFRVQTEVSASPTFFGWVFGFNGKVQILAPEIIPADKRRTESGD